jgi:hypothetical protein
VHNRLRAGASEKACYPPAMEPVDLTVDVQDLVIDGVPREARVPVGNRTYGVTENPDPRRPGWVLLDVQRRTVVEPGVVYPAALAAAQAAWEREQPD